MIGEKKIILGNLNNQSFNDIWFSKKAMKIRKMLNNSNRNFSPCNVCDVDGTLMGKRIQLISSLLCLLALHRKKLLIFQKN